MAKKKLPIKDAEVEELDGFGDPIVQDEDEDNTLIFDLNSLESPTASRVVSAGEVMDELNPYNAPIAPELDMATVSRMAARRLSAQEVADYHDVTLEELAEFIRVQTGKPMLRFFGSAQVMVKEEILRCQLEAAKKGNAPVLIWLGKNYCGQKDNPEDTEGVVTVVEMPDFGESE